MKQEPKNQMDLLLRRLGRRDDATVPDADHLDADELNAYTENALPAAARARYTAHLAECSRCRELVVQLSASAGVVVAAESAKVAEPSGWKKFLANLFTPMVLRYAAPALGLLIVAGIGFMILRRDQRSQYVTQVTNTEQRPTAPVAEQPAARVSNEAQKPAPSPDNLRDKQSRGLQTEAPASVPNTPPTVSSVDTEVSKDTAAATQPKPEPSSANEPPPPPKAAATPTPEESPRAAEQEMHKKEYREQPAAAPAANKALMTEAKREDKDNFARTRKSKGEPADEVSAQGAGSVGNLQRGGSDLSANTRSVAGRRFRKQGGIWIDTAYDSSKDTVSLTRDSEQYRALVADEPAIKTIADTLDGEIIVVWKGHTYRIR